MLSLLCGIGTLRYIDLDEAFCIGYDKLTIELKIFKETGHPNASSKNREAEAIAKSPNGR